MVLHSFKSNYISGHSFDVPYARVKHGQYVGGFVEGKPIIAAARTTGHSRVFESTMLQQYSDRTALSFLLSCSNHFMNSVFSFLSLFVFWKKVKPTSNDHILLTTIHIRM
jgi:hypothetical protein